MHRVNNTYNILYNTVNANLPLYIFRLCKIMFLDR